MLENLRRLVCNTGLNRANSRSMEVGWAVTTETASLIWDEPRTFRRSLPKSTSAKAVQSCPAVLDFDSRHVVIPCPIDLDVRFELDAQGRPSLKNMAGESSSVRNSTLGKMVVLLNKTEWRHSDRPIIQFLTPYLFLADEPVYLNQLPPYLEYMDPGWPGVLIGGRFPIHIWPRHLMWAFEWHDLTKPLQLRRGQPWFYLRFEASDLRRPVRLVETEITPDVRAFIDGISGVTNYVNRTFSLFPLAEKRRPPRLLHPIRRHRGSSNPCS